jgi:hypothetical protein
MKNPRKPCAVPLDEYAERIWNWSENEMLTLAQISERLKESYGLVAKPPRLSTYLAKMRKERVLEARLRMIADGSATCRKVEAQFSKSPPPSLQTITGFFRVLIMELASNGLADPEMLELAGDLMKTALAAAAEERKEKEFHLSQESFRRQTCELFLEWQQNQEAQRIAASPSTHAEKLDQLYRAMFGEERRQLSAPPS